MPRPLITSLLALLLPSSSTADDQITLENNDLYFGEVLALKNGFIELKTPHSETPLKIINQNLSTLSFEENDAGELPVNSQILTLHNTDHFPGEIIKLSDTHLTFQTWFAGDLEIPRKLIDSIHFGVTPQRTTFQGPKRLSDWTQDSSGGWTLRKGTLTSSKPTFIGKNLNLPENFIFAAQIAWKNSPNLRIHICSNQLQPLDKKPSDSYLISITRSGIEVKRVMPEDSSGPTYRTLISHTINLQSIASKNIQLELRANRKDRSLQLYLDGNELEQGLDPSDPPLGTHVLFESLSTTRSSTLISKIIVQEWDSSTQRLHREPREADQLDTLSVAEGDRFSGRITSYDPHSPDLPFTVKSPLSEDPIRIPLAHCSVIYFTKEPQNSQTPQDPSESKKLAKRQTAKQTEPPYRLHLHTGGQLTLSQIQLGETTLKASHPSLGQLQIKRNVMKSINKGQ